MHIFLRCHQSRRRSFCGTKTFRVKMAIYTYFRSYLAMPKNFGQSYMKKFDINENLIGDGMGCKISRQSLKNQALETPSYLKMSPTCHNFSSQAVTGHKKSFDLIFVSVFFLFIFHNFFQVFSGFVKFLFSFVCFFRNKI